MRPLDEEQHHLLRARLLAHPDLCTSHKVVVVDQSASMKKSDVDNFASRSHAVFGTIALVLIGKHLDDEEHISGTDVLTLIEMRDDATTILFREPITNVLFNDVVSRMHKSTPRSHGNFLPAIDAATKAMAMDLAEDTCAVMFMFLSDGKPSDKKANFAADLVARMLTMGKQFGARLRVGTIGFAAAGEDMRVLEDMAAAATAAGAHATFTHAQRNATALSTAVSDLRTDLSAVRSSLTTTGRLPGEAAAKARLVAQEKQIGKLTQEVVADGAWDMYAAKRFVLGPKDEWVAVPMQQPGATGLAIRQKIFGEGAERIVHGLIEIKPVMTPEGETSRTVGPLMAGKDSRFETSDPNEMKKFHKVFCRTQRTAGKLAAAFNRAVAQCASNMPTIVFLECYVYQYDMRHMLVEKMLLGEYKKWNGNNGYVANQAVQTPDIHKLLRQLNIRDTIAEGSDEEDDDEVPPTTTKGVSPAKKHLTMDVDLVPQAFSHYSYFFTKRRHLVCDLQGVFDAAALVFELTDPVIHHCHSKGRSRRFGKTDMGQKGVHSFFATHTCNALCKALRLPST
ncbi:Aste57867_23452 [Aphanomyces stellatus]|uniref:Aste57867_23452 protein n=1 Tax=Aphanomyces stellatus TaxID=120398 RepID=A0A485LMP1_9STRA|nr:hypothetical protein As57867_023381 [Aphanomyces stellatus]VFU00098.1 Aste57867_23452 [Aphanomyces stellatus]